MNVFSSQAGGQFGPAQGGRFKPARHGLLKLARGGQLYRRFHLNILIPKNIFLYFVVDNQLVNYLS